ncbi:hypothetical protein [Brachybacterium massiliense]|uniref:hypothetical protein n=1 Tax=Brachybacterium massiliense TaxID=1755098 RepID=UPI000B3BCDC1|nr:hypothetical protein [Brachybacterium massiliense]
MTDQEQHDDAYTTLYGEPAKPELTDDAQAAYDAVYGKPEPAPMPDDERAIYDFFYPGNTAN